MEKPISFAERFKFITPDGLSYLATVITIVVAFFYYFALQNPTFLLWAIALIVVRMALNKIDGDIAFQKATLSMKGKIMNAVPDRYSDMILIIGIGLSSMCRPIFSLLGIATVALISYTGVLGKALGFDWQNQGPLGKVERLILIMLFSLVQYILLVNGLQNLALGLTALEWGMVLLIVLGQLTVMNRLLGISKENTKLEWLTDEKYKAITKKILIAYDSETGNTERVAEEISNCLKVGIRKIEDITNVDAYDLVIFGSRESGQRPSQKIIDFIQEHQDIKEYAVFITYRNHLLGAIHTQMYLSCFKKLLNKNPLAVFSCKAAYEKEEVYLEHLYKDPNLLNAFLFGIKVNQNLNKLK
jgi:phosphatidylglycerophosphate synthase/flavodoxin